MHRPYRVLALALVALLVAGPADAQPTRPPPKIGVVDLGRLVQQSPQASKAKQNMAERFAKRKKALEQASANLQSEMDRLQDSSDAMSEDERDRLTSRIRDDKHELQLKQSQYNDDVSDAEHNELESMRSQLRQVIDDYAREHGYDLIVGESVLYASDSVDITGAVLQRLKQKIGADGDHAAGSNADKAD